MTGIPSIITIIIAVGILAGILDFLLREYWRLPSRSWIAPLAKSIVTASVGALCIPIILSIVELLGKKDSNFIDSFPNPEAPISSWFLLFGLCLAVSALSLRIANDQESTSYSKISVRIEGLHEKLELLGTETTKAIVELNETCVGLLAIDSLDDFTQHWPLDLLQSIQDGKLKVKQCSEKDLMEKLTKMETKRVIKNDGERWALTRFGQNILDAKIMLESS